MRHGCMETALCGGGTAHTKWHRSRGVQPSGSPCANNHCSTRYEQSFRHNKHTHTNQKAATDKHSIEFIANYIKERKAYTTYRNHTSKQRQFKTGVPQGGVLSPTLFNICTSDLPPPSSPFQVMAYAHDITITSTQTSTRAAKNYIQPYLHNVFAWTKQNNILLNPDKTTCTLFSPDPAEYTSNLDLTINTKHYPWQHTQRFWVLS